MDAVIVNNGDIAAATIEVPLMPLFLLISM